MRGLRTEGALKIRYMLLVLLYCAGIFWLSAQPQPPQPTLTFPGADKVYHALLFGGLGAVVSIGLRWSPPQKKPPLQFWAPVAFAAVFGGIDETHQLFVPDRAFDPLDLVADAAGPLLLQLVLCGAVWRIPLGEAVGIARRKQTQ